MSEYDSIVTTENSDIENNFDTEKSNIDKSKKDKCKYKKYILYCIIFVFILYGIYWIYFWNIITININTNFDNVEKNELTAHLPFHHHHKTCDDFKFGCCEVIDNKNKKHILSLYRIVKNDEEGSNCPSFDTLINKYIKYIREYYSDSIVDCNTVECCKKYDIIIPTKNCPNSYEIVYEYNTGYSDPYQGLYILTVMIILLFCWLLCN
tara:strand:- start:637 stop:1260 length:624 start_codon:yes stop_codon:yes gene_type:complete